MTEYEARLMLYKAAEYLYKNQLGQPSRVRAMDILDDIRRDWANWHNLSTFHGVNYRSFPVLRGLREVAA